MLTSEHAVIAGLGLDVAGAVIFISSLARTKAADVAQEIPLRGGPVAWFDPDLVITPTPLPGLARARTREIAEAQLGLVFLAGGFAVQLVAYVFLRPGSGLDGFGERGTAFAILALTWAAALVAYKLYVPSRARRIFESASSTSGVAQRGPHG